MSIPENSVERRHHRRVVLHGPAQLQIQGGPSTPIRTLNISVGGLSAVASVNPGSDAQCLVHIDIPEKGGGATPTELSAQVVQSAFSKIDDGYIVNFKFINLTASAAARIARFMASVG